MTAIPPGLEQAIATWKALRDRQEVGRRRRQEAASAPRAAPVPLPARPRPWPQPGQERLNRPVSVGKVVRYWWNRDL